MSIQVVCPFCRVSIREGERDWNCPECGRVFATRNGVRSFLDPDEVFNEGHFEGSQKTAWSASAQLRDRIRRSRFLTLLNLFRIKFSLSGRRDRIFYNEMSGGDRNRAILDLGCGGGRHYFCDYGRVVGIDPVLELLTISKEIYEAVYQANAARLPFADGTFDYVVSSDVIGHIPESIKDRVFAEIYRVLKRGGRTVNVIETDAVNGWFRFAHRYPELFQKYFVDRPGHISLELPSQLRARFLKHGFKEITFNRQSSRLMEVGSVSGLFGNEYRSKSRAVSFWVGVDKVLSSNLAIQELMNLVLEPVARLDDACSPLDYTAGAMVVFEK